MKKYLAAALAAALALSLFTGCSSSAVNSGDSSAENTPALTVSNPISQTAVKAPKYVFLFIGDGMSYPQIQSTADYLGALNDEDYFLAQPSLDDNQGAILDGPSYLNFMNFPVAGTDYDTYLTLLENQTISFAKYDSDYVADYKANKTSFENVLKDIETLFGLKVQGEENDKLVLTEYELAQLKTAYEKSINGTAASKYEQQEYVLYGTYEPLTVTITHILNNKSGVSFTSYSHTGLPVAVLADGVNAESFVGYYDNIEIYQKLAAMLKVK